MKMLYRSFPYLCLLFFVACDENEITSRDYPRLHTLEVSDVSESGATFGAEITFSGDFEILQYGFVWSQNQIPTLQASSYVILSEDNPSGKFTTTIRSTLAQDRIYYMRPFVKTKDYLVYGKIVEFLSLGSDPPVIMDFFPKEGVIGDTISIIGEGFSNISGANTVTFNSTEAQIISIADTLLRVIVPDAISSVESSVSVEIVERKRTADQKFVLRVPQLLSAERTTIHACEVFTFNVANIGPASHPGIYFNGKGSHTVSIRDNQIKVVVPILPKNDLSVEIRLALGTFESILPEPLTLIPPQFKITPERSSFLDTVTVHFTNLQDCETDLFVENNALIKLEETDTYIKAILPASLEDAWRVRLQARSNSEVVFDTIYYRVLSVESITPSAASPGEIITIRGRGYHPILQNNKVCFDCHGTGFGTHGEIIGGDIHTLIVKVPSMPAGPTNIHLFTQNLGTLGTPFEVK